LAVKNNANTQRIKIMTKRSAPLADKLNNLFVEERDPIAEQFNTLVDTSLSLTRFDDQTELESYLAEGALLNISTLGSKALSIPSGEYMVWLTDIGHTMLVPTQDKKSYGGVFGEYKDKQEVLTASLLDLWPKMERSISEESEPPPQDGSDTSEGEKETPEGQQIQSRVDPADIDRSPILRAMEDRGYTVTSLAAEVGVQAPAISRLLRVPKDVQGDPGGRNPSMGLAAQISNALRMDPTALFPDIFGIKPGDDYEARDTPGNRGSGMKNSAAGSTRMNSGGTWTQGNSQ
jgi:transcriptional regulator with XRE-family HTH domain